METESITLAKLLPNSTNGIACQNRFWKFGVSVKFERLYDKNMVRD
jgi:hypothetical protein